MVKNKKFAGYTVAFCILGIVFMFLYSGLQNDQINIIQGYSAWENTATQMSMTVGNFVCIVLTFVFGVIDDKLGTPIASLILGITEFFPIIGLMSQAKAVAETGACNVPMLVLWGFGVACMTGGVPTMHPASVSFMFGRREYQSANRVIMAIQLIPSAVAAMMMTILINNGQGALAYGILIAVVIFGIVTTLPMLKMKDANAEGRG